MRHAKPDSRARFALASATAALALLSLVPSAGATVTRARVASFGPDGTAATSFSNPGQLAVDQANHRLYVRTAVSPSVHCLELPALTPCGAPFPLAISELSDAFALATRGLTVDNTAGATAGNIYVATGEGNKILGYDSAGAPLGGSFPIMVPGGSNGPGGVAVDSAGNIWVPTSGFTGNDKGFKKYDSAGNPLPAGDIKVPGTQVQIPRNAAIDSDDNLYLGGNSTSNTNWIWRYTAPTYDVAAAVKIDLPLRRGDQQIVADTGVDPNRLYVADNGIVSVLESDGSPLYAIPNKGELSPIGEWFAGVSVDQATDTAYVADALEGKVYAYGPPADYPDATVTDIEATEVGATTADFEATIDDNGPALTDWRFEVSKDGGATWSKPAGGVSGGTDGGQSGATIVGDAAQLDHSTSYLLRVVTSKGGPEDEVATDGGVGFETELVPDASATMAPPANVTATGAELAGQITDNGPFATEWRFEVSADGGANWATATQGGLPVSGKTAGGETDAPVGGVADGLLPNTEYLARLTTTKGGNSTDASTAPQAFTTDPAPPLVADVGAFAVEDTSATLVGQVDPRGSGTSYVFRWGTAGPCASNPCAATDPVAVGAGQGSLTVAAAVAGLAPDAAYHLELEATNAAGSSLATGAVSTRAAPRPPLSPPGCPNRDLREEQGSTHLPDCRAYEQVSPEDKAFADVDSAGDIGKVATDGHAVRYTAFGSFGDPQGWWAGVKAAYLSHREAGGWRTRGALPIGCTLDPDSDKTNTQGVATPTFIGFPDLAHAFITVPQFASCPVPPLDPAAPRTKQDAYLADLGTEPPTYTLIAPAAHSVASLLGAGEDASRVVYLSDGKQTPDAPEGAFAKVFEWHDGALSLLSRDTANQPLLTASGRPKASITEFTSGGAFIGELNGVSADGSRVFFQSPSASPAPAGQELYMRQNASVTYHVSQSECTASCGDGAADEFLAATPIGNKALFLSAAKLTNDDDSTTGDIYLYTHSGNPAINTNLTLISADSEPADEIAAEVSSYLGMSTDGETVYFAAKGQLVAGGPVDIDPETEAPAPISPKVYRWRRNGGSPTLEQIGTLAGSELGADTRYVSPDGDLLLLSSRAPLNPATDRDTSRDVYRWTAAEGWSCLSCQAPGAPSAGDSGAEGANSRFAVGEEGALVFFTSKDRLVGADENDVSDVYEWNEGTVGLISGGRGGEASKLVGAGASGEDVFFVTIDPLVGWDGDDNVDVYDARVGGGFLEPDPRPAPCDLGGGACEEGGTSAPAAAGAGTAAFEGPGNPRPGAGSGGGRCGRLAVLARKQVSASRRLRRRARRLATTARRLREARRKGARRKARRLTAVARKRSRAAKQNANRAKRCRRVNRGARR